MTVTPNGIVENAPPNDHKSFILGMITLVRHGKEKSRNCCYLYGRIRVKGIPSQSIGRQEGVGMESSEKEALPMDDLKGDELNEGETESKESKEAKEAKESLEKSGSTTAPVNVVSLPVFKFRK